MASSTLPSALVAVHLQYSAKQILDIRLRLKHIPPGPWFSAKLPKKLSFITYLPTGIGFGGQCSQHRRTNERQ